MTRGVLSTILDSERVSQSDIDPASQRHGALEACLALGNGAWLASWMPTGIYPRRQSKGNRPRTSPGTREIELGKCYKTGSLIGMERCMGVDLFSSLQSSRVLDHSLLSSDEMYSEVEVAPGPAVSWLYLRHCASTTAHLVHQSSRPALRIHKPSRLPSDQSTWPLPTPAPSFASARTAPTGPRDSATWCHTSCTCTCRSSLSSAPSPTAP